MNNQEAFWSSGFQSNQSNNPVNAAQHGNLGSSHGDQRFTVSQNNHLSQQNLSQQALSQQALNQQALNQQALNQQALNQQALNQQALSQQALSQQALSQQALSQQALSQQALEETRGLKTSKGVNMATVIQETKKATEEILRDTALKGSRYGYLANWTNVPNLIGRELAFPKLKTTVTVGTGDTYDTALAMYQRKNTTDFMPICVLNFANAQTIGGGWERGAQAQEEQLFYRSTLSGSLQRRFYPMQELDCVYSPHVIVFRENSEKHYAFMKHPQVVSVLSMAAEKSPALSRDSTAYANAVSRELMERKMRIILRTAGINNHRRLVLGALGCGAFGHPAREVANCWRKVLLEEEFRGWFAEIEFAIKDKAHKNNYGVFQEILGNLNMSSS